jgi:hypothetical protein
VVGRGKRQAVLLAQQVECFGFDERDFSRPGVGRPRRVEADAGGVAIADQPGASHGFYGRK